jgi:hypothetical protein
MDRRALRGRLRAKFDEAMDRAMDAVEAAPDGRWIAGSEWAVRGAFQGLMRECFQEIVQAKVDSDPAAAAGSFPPGAGPGHAAGGGAVQGRAARRRAQRRR